MTKKKDILADVYRAVVGKPGEQLFLYLCGEPTIQAFEYIKVAFQEIKQLIKERVTITLDTDNIPKEYFQADLGESYFMTYSEFFISNLQSAAPDPKSEAEDSEDGDAPDKESNIEELFQINKEMLEREYNLTTLNLEKIAMVNFKDILSRQNKHINDDDIVLPTESTDC